MPVANAQQQVHARQDGGGVDLGKTLKDIAYLPSILFFYAICIPVREGH